MASDSLFWVGNTVVAGTRVIIMGRAGRHYTWETSGWRIIVKNDTQHSPAYKEGGWTLYLYTDELFAWPDHVRLSHTLFHRTLVSCNSLKATCFTLTLNVTCFLDHLQLLSKIFCTNYKLHVLYKPVVTNYSSLKKL